MKHLFIAFLMVLSLSSYAQDKTARYNEALLAHNKKVVEYFFDALERKDYGQLNTIIDFSGSGVWSTQNKDSFDTLKGREAIGAKLRASVDSFYKVRYSTKVNKSADPSVMTVRVKGLLQGADGAKTERNYMAIFKLKDGKILEYIEYNNSTPESRS